MEEISIHALRGEGDFFPLLIVILSSEISIHALRGEGDSLTDSANIKSLIFQSTPSVGRATMVIAYIKIKGRFQSTPSVGRATLRTNPQ